MKVLTHVPSSVGSVWMRCPNCAVLIGRGGGSQAIGGKTASFPAAVDSAGLVREPGVQWGDWGWNSSPAFHFWCTDWITYCLLKYILSYEVLYRLKEFPGQARLVKTSAATLLGSLFEPGPVLRALLAFSRLDFSEGRPEAWRESGARRSTLEAGVRAVPHTPTAPAGESGTEREGNGRCRVRGGLTLCFSFLFLFTLLDVDVLVGECLSLSSEYDILHSLLVAEQRKMHRSVEIK